MRLALLLLLLALAPAASAQDARVEHVRFARGASSATVSDAVVRGEVVRYVLGARAGQRMEVAVRSTEGNAAFSVFLGSGTDAELRAAYAGGTPPVLAALFTEWRARLAEDGTYVVEVSSTRGNASYTATFSIR